MRLELCSVRSPVGCFGLLLSLVAGLLFATSPASGVAGYGDVADGKYFTEPVQWSVDNDITGIDGDCFLPDAPVSRGDAAVYIWNMEGQPSAPAHSFVDITDENQNAAVSWMLHNGITTGTTESTFDPDTTLTRAHLVTFLHRLAGEPEAPTHPFVDVHESWQQAGVSWASDTGITTGTSPTTFSPDRTLTRAHLVTFLWRYQDKPEVTVDPDTPPCDPDTDPRFNTFSAGGAHSCGVRTNGTVECWGWNDNGQADPPAGEFTTVAAGYWHSCGVRTNGTIACWGSNHSGQADPPAGEFASVAADQNHSCGVRTNGTIACWGHNDVGQADPPAGQFATVDTGAQHSCGLRTNGAIACWGHNRDSHDDFYTGQSDPPAGEFTAVSAGDWQSCGVRTNGAVECWGNNEWRAVPPAGEFTAVSAGSSHACGVRTNGTVECWGNNEDGRSDPLAGEFASVVAGGHSCGLRSNGIIECWGSNYHGETDPPGAEFTAINAGASHTCGLRTNGTINCWGNNDARQTDPPAGQFTAITAGTWHSCGVRTNGAVECWGNNYYGQTDPPTGQFTAITAGASHTCGLRTNGAVECWGNNDARQTDPPTDQFTAIAAGASHTCGLRTNGAVECWGNNDARQTDPPTDQFTAITAGASHTCGLRTNGAVECWGNNDARQTDPPTDQFTAITAGASHTCGLRTNGAVECWGNNDARQTDPPTDQFTAITAGTWHTCGLRTNGTFKCWGNTNYEEPDPPTINVIQAVYVVPSNKTPVVGQAEAIAHEIGEVKSWFDTQTGGKHPIFARDGNSISVATVNLSDSLEVIDTVTRILFEIHAALPATENQPLALFVEGELGTESGGNACGWTDNWNNPGWLVIPIENCNIRPLQDSVWYYGATYLLAHELTHLLGAVASCAPNHNFAHVDDDRRDIIYFGPGGRDWDNLMLDPGNDDYYKHGRDDCPDIADSPLLGTD